MFDVSFVELMVIGLVALIVLGPERLPGAARTVGAMVRKARNSWNSVKSEIERELAAIRLDEQCEAVAQPVLGLDHLDAERELQWRGQLHV